MIITIDGGPETKMLEHYALELERLGLNKKFLYSDVIDCLKIKDDFYTEVTSLCTDITFGDYFEYATSRSTQSINREDFAYTVRTVCQTMYDTLITRGLYTEQGEFPYEFREYKYGQFFLRSI